MTSPKALMKAWNLYPRKRLGQNFLNDPIIAKTIVENGFISGKETVLEIGAGLGALTLPLARIAKRVYAIERDARLLKLLKTELTVSSLSNVTLQEADILSFDIPALARELGTSLVVMGNLPYNISSQIIVQLIQSRSVIKRAVIMLQREMAHRITSPPGSKSYGRLSVMLQYCADVKRVAKAPANSFYPRPNVDSEVIEFRFKQMPDTSVEAEKHLFRVVKAAFGNRRKTLKNSLLAGGLALDSQRVIEVLNAAAIAPVRRAETLSVSEFVALAHQIAAQSRR